MNIMYLKAATGGIFYVIEKLTVKVLQVLTFFLLITTKDQFFFKNPVVQGFP